MKPLVHGFGIDDAIYQTTIEHNKTLQECPYHRQWRNMIRSCYSRASGLTICMKWRSFMAFREWMEVQDYEGRRFISWRGGEYSPSNCAFVDKAVFMCIKAGKDSDHKMAELRDLANDAPDAETSRMLFSIHRGLRK